MSDSVRARVRVLITGATGFIGRHVVPLAVARGVDVIAMSRYPRQSAQAGIRWVEGDVLDKATVTAIIDHERPTHLLHLAWITEPGVYWTSPANEAWMFASGHLFEHFYSSGGERAVGAGTCAEFDWLRARVDEATSVVPHTLYGTTKHETHRGLARSAKEAGRSYAWGRVHFLYGPGEPTSRFVPSLALPLLRGQPAICRKPSLVRDWLHVSDVAAAFVTLLDASVDGAVSIVSGAPISHGDLARRVAAEAGHPECLHLGDTPPDSGEPLEIRGNAGALTAHWAPRLSLDEGVAQTVAGLRESPAP